MDEKTPFSPKLADRIARFLRALRRVALTGRLVDQQSAELMQLRAEQRDLTNSITRMDARQVVADRALATSFAEWEARTQAAQRTTEASVTELQIRGEANLVHVRHELAYLSGRINDLLAARERSSEIFAADTAPIQIEMSSAFVAMLTAHRELEKSHSELKERAARLEARLEVAGVALSLPPLPRAGDIDSATWLYAAFEETFRGTRAQVRERLGSYVADSVRAHRATASAVLDVGCGRGEWLELMRDADVPARGIDDNAMVIEQCRELALDAVRADAIAYLQEVPRGSLGVISAFHVLEHLPHARQLQLLVAARLALAPEGLLILETPNPENLIVGAWTFRMDPTHICPIPPGLLYFLVQAAGFDVIDMRRLHPDPGLAQRASEEQWPAGLQELLCGPRDVGILARPSKG